MMQKAVKHPLGHQTLELCKAIVDLVTSRKCRGLIEAARHLYQFDLHFGHYSNHKNIAVIFCDQASEEQKNIVQRFSRTITSDMATFTNILAENRLIETVSDAWYLWRTFQSGIPFDASDRIRQRKDQRLFLNAVRNASDPLGKLEKFPKHLKSKNLATATSSLRLLKARAEYRHPDEQPGRILENAVPDYLLKEMLGKWIDEWKARSCKEDTSLDRA